MTNSYLRVPTLCKFIDTYINYSKKSMYRHHQEISDMAKFQRKYDVFAGLVGKMYLGVHSVCVQVHPSRI